MGHYEVVGASSAEYPKLFITAMLMITPDKTLDILYMGVMMFKERAAAITVHFGSDVQENPNMPLTFSRVYLNEKDNVSVGVGRFGDLAKKAIMNIDMSVRKGRAVGLNIVELLK